MSYLSDRSFLITSLALLQTSAWRQTYHTPFLLSSCCRLSLGSNEIPEYSQWAGSRPAAPCLEPSAAGSGVEAILQEIWKEFICTRDRLTFARFARVSQDVFI